MKAGRTYRNMPKWPTYLARLAALAVFLGGPFALRSFPYIAMEAQSWLFLFGISGCIAIVVGALVMHFCEWLVNAHLNSVESKSRFNLGLMFLTAGLLIVGIAGLVLQWQK